MSVVGNQQRMLGDLLKSNQPFDSSVDAKALLKELSGS